MFAYPFRFIAKKKQVGVWGMLLKFCDGIGVIVGRTQAVAVVCCRGVCVVTAAHMHGYRGRVGCNCCSKVLRGTVRSSGRQGTASLPETIR